MLLINHVINTKHATYDVFVYHVAYDIYVYHMLLMIIMCIICHL